MVLRVAAVALLAASVYGAAPRSVRIQGQQFVLSANGAPIVMAGPNVVVKGPPYLPSTNGSGVCEDVVDDACTATGTCISCLTFTAADAANLKSLGMNAIRLGVVWAGAQPRDEDALDPAFLARLDAVLTLTDAAGIHVVLDNHGDMVGSAGCGNGAPMWVQQAAAASLIGQPLVTGFPYSLVPSLDISALDGYSTCGNDTAKWAAFAGDPNYNLLNECCQAMNSNNPGALGFTTLGQATMDYIITNGTGRDAFVRFWRLMAEAVADHPSAFAAELMNEPMTIFRTRAFDTWRAAGQAITAVIPDMSVSVSDIGEGVLIPPWVIDIIGGGELISNETLEWIQTSGNVFYAWHWYGAPANASDAVQYALSIGNYFKVPTFATEFMDCSAWRATAAAGISHLYWHYSSYCTTGPSFGNRSVPDDTFGACILGWAGGNSNYTC